MNTTTVSSIGQLQSFLDQLNATSSKLLYRGQPVANWPVTCSAARRLTQNSTDPISLQLIDFLLVGYLESLVAKAKLLQFIPSGIEDNTSDIILLALLQHHGAATGLIDFTQQVLVALWFACNERYDEDGAIHILHRSQTEEITRNEMLNAPIQHFFQGDTLWSWEPAPLGNRIVAQNSIFVFGNAEITPNQLEKVIIQASHKRHLLDQLENQFGIHEEKVYPDFPGFAFANSSTKTFDTYRTVSYWQEQVFFAQNNNQAATAFYHCGVAHMTAQNPEQAIKNFDEAIELNPSHKLAHYNRGNTKIQLYELNADPGLLEKAIQDFDAANSLGYDDYTVYNNRALAKKSLGDHANAILDFEAALNRKPDLANVYLHMGEIKAELGLQSEAISDYISATQADPHLATPHFRLGAVNIESGNHQDAVTYLSDAIRIDPTQPDYYYRRGFALRELRRFREAISDFDKAITLNPNDARSLQLRGACKILVEPHEEAIEDLSEAIRLNPNNAESHLYRGWIYQDLGEEEKAKKDLEKSLALAHLQEKPETIRLTQERLKQLNTT